MKKRWFRYCYICGRKCVPCIDNFGQQYMGCSRCVIVDPTDAGKP